MTYPTDDKPLPGRIDTLTDEQTALLKQMWQRLFTLFQQKGEPWPPIGDNNKEKQKSNNNNKKNKKKNNDDDDDDDDNMSQKSGKKKSKKKTHQEQLKEFIEREEELGFDTNLFIGKTSNPAWSSLPLEKAIPLIPGDLLQLSFWNMISADNPDAVVLRYLRARKWDLDAGYKMLLNTLRWRIYIRVDDVCALGETGMVKALEKLKPGMGQQFYDNIHCNKTVIGGPDKAGRGVCFVNPRFHKKEDQDFEVLKLLTVYVMENSRMIVHQPMDTGCIVFNLEGFTLINMDFDFVKFLLICFETHYPETLGVCIIHKVPWVFSTVWAMVSPLLDPVVAAKARFTKNTAELCEFIDMDVLPPFMAGKETIKLDDGYSVENFKKNPPPPEGSLIRPQVPQVDYYNIMIEEYERYTKKWMADPLTKASDPERKQYALMYRHTTINAELFLRGRTSYHYIGLAAMVNGRFLLQYMGKVPTLDITDCV